MKVLFENLGIIRSAEFCPSEFMIICGDNNSGKSYITYAWYGFLYYFNHKFRLADKDDLFNQLIKNGETSYLISKDLDSIQEILNQACSGYKEYIHEVFAIPQECFSDFKLHISLEPGDIDIKRKYTRNFRRRGNNLFQIIKKDGDNEIHFSWMSDESLSSMNVAFRSTTAFLIVDAIRDVILGNTIPEPNVICAERTGMTVFRKDLDHLPQLRLAQEPNNPQYRYSLPIVMSLSVYDTLDIYGDFTCPFAEEHPEILNQFATICGGKFEYDENSNLIYYVSDRGESKFTMAQSSSSVRALADLFFYLKYAAKPGHLLIIDEPELNLHPSRQIALCRLLAMLANYGIKILITTHSDYIVREINNLCILKSKPNCDIRSEILGKYGIYDDSLISSEEVMLYTAASLKENPNKSTLVESQFDEDYGFDAKIFDDTLQKVIELQDEIRFSNYGKI